jgi:hypothetical protein
MPMDNMTDDERAYAAAFEDDMGPSSPIESADLVAEGGQDGGGEPGSGPVVVESGDAAEATAGAEADPALPGEAAADPEAAAPSAPQVDLDKEMQRLRSWEGRLRAMEAKIKAGAGADAAAPAQPGDAGEEAVGEALEKVAEGTDNPELSEAAEEVAEAVESGEMTAAQAMKQLAEDFGEDFVRMIEVVATAKAREAGEKVIGEKVGELSKTVNEIIDDLVDGKAKSHFKAIAEKHPDFNEVGQSPEFKAYIEGLPESERADAQRIAQGGSSDEVIKLLDGYKASANKAPSEEDTSTADAMDAAEGVRSSGLVLPEAPAPASDDYEGAWKEF